MQAQPKADPIFLESMLGISKRQPELYQPGPYWVQLARNSVRQIKRRGISDFRGNSTSLALSYSDCVLTDLRLAPGPKSNLKKLWYGMPIVRRTIEAQKTISDSWSNQAIMLSATLYERSSRVQELMSKYEIQSLDTTIGTPVQTFSHSGGQVSSHYMDLLDSIDRTLDKEVALPHSVLEIGGGFGATAHMMVSLLGVKKYIYVDIAPNLYVGTQYLRSLFGDSVRDCTQLAEGAEFRFSRDDALEIFCILPGQLEFFQGEVDFVWNSHSFVEMPEEAVRNYAGIVRSKLAKSSNIVLVSYSEYDPETTLNPHSLPNFFGLPSNSFEATNCIGTRTNVYHVLASE